MHIVDLPVALYVALLLLSVLAVLLLSTAALAVLAAERFLFFIALFIS